MEVDNTFANARQLGVARDWTNIFHYQLEQLVRDISINLLANGLTIEKVYKATGLSDEEQVLKRKLLWNRVLAFLDDKTCKEFDIACAIFKERRSEIAMNLLKMGMSIEIVSDATGLSIQQIEKLHNKN